jgi:hypothetical protein
VPFICRQSGKAVSPSPAPLPPPPPARALRTLHLTSSLALRMRETGSSIGRSIGCMLMYYLDMHASPRIYDLILIKKLLGMPMQVRAVSSQASWQVPVCVIPMRITIQNTGCPPDYPMQDAPASVPCHTSTIGFQVNFVCNM